MQSKFRKLSAAFLCVCLLVTHSYSYSQQYDEQFFIDGTCLPQKLQLLCMELLRDIAQGKDHSEVVKVLADFLENYKKKAVNKACCGPVGCKIGKRGKKGERGRAGSTGVTGATGATGATGLPGVAATSSLSSSMSSCTRKALCNNSRATAERTASSLAAPVSIPTTATVQSPLLWGTEAHLRELFH
jgi:hypothetical protein